MYHFTPKNQFTLYNAEADNGNGRAIGSRMFAVIVAKRSENVSPSILGGQERTEYYTNQISEADPHYFTFMATPFSEWHELIRVIPNTSL